MNEVFISSESFRFILPEIIISATAFIILTFEMFYTRLRNYFAYIAALGLVIALGVIIIQMPQSHDLFGGSISSGPFENTFGAICILASLLATLVTETYFRERRENRGELYALLLLATVGMVLMSRANDLLIIFLGLELLSLCLYVLVNFFRTDLRSDEAGLKYLLLGAFSTSFFLFGIALFYGLTGSFRIDAIAEIGHLSDVFRKLYLLVGFAMLVIGFAFKVALVPFHMWSPDVYEGAPTAVTAFLSTGPKVAGFSAFLKVFAIAFSGIHADWMPLLWVIAVITMTIGNLSALVQTNIKRMLAFSSIAHAGYISIGLLVNTVNGASAMIFYLSMYILMNIGAFSVIVRFETREGKYLHINEYSGLAYRNPWLSLAMALFMFALAGIPPTAGFIGKYFLFSAAIQQGYIWLAIIAVLNSLVAVYYYLRIIVILFMKPGKTEPVHRAIRPALVLSVLFSAAALMYFGIFPSDLMVIAYKSAIVFF